MIIYDRFPMNISRRINHVVHCGLDYIRANAAQIKYAHVTQKRKIKIYT